MKYGMTDPRADPGYWYFPVIGLLLVLIIAYGLGTLRGQENVRRGLEPHRHAMAAADRIQTYCASRKSADFLDCITERIEKSEEVSRTEQDLTAQQQAAWGSMISAGSALSTVLITIIGLTWIKATLNATQETARAAIDANRISNEQNRGWLSVELLDIGPVTKSVMGSIISVEIRYKLRNAGQSPVTNLSDSVIGVKRSLSPSEKHKRLLSSISGRRSSGFVLGLAPGESIEREYSVALNNNDMTLGYVGLITTAVFEVWVGGDYDTKGVNGLSATTSLVTVTLPAGHFGLAAWAASPISQKVGAIMT